MLLYHVVSCIKIVLGLAVLLLVYNFIHIHEDPVVAISLAFVSVFILAWGVSFYVFLLMQRLVRHHTSYITSVIDSYKLSLLFGIYAVINVALLLLGQWTKMIGLFLLIGFIMLQVLLFASKKINQNE